MAAYGLLILGPSQHLWFNFLSQILPKRDIVTIMKKIVVGQVIYGPSITTIFFSYNAVLRGKQKFCMDYSFQTYIITSLLPPLDRCSLFGLVL